MLCPFFFLGGGGTLSFVWVVVSIQRARPQEPNTVFYHRNYEMGTSRGMGLLQSTLCDSAGKLLQVCRAIQFERGLQSSLNMCTGWPPIGVMIPEAV